MTAQSDSLSENTNNWNPSPSKNEGSFGYEVINRLLLYGFLGYLPEDACSVLLMHGPKQAEMAILLEQNGYDVTMLCNPGDDSPGCLAKNIKDIDSDSFDAVVFPGWLTDYGQTEKMARQAIDILKDKGLFVGSFPGRFAASLDFASKSLRTAKELASSEQEGSWHGATELYSPNESITMLEAVGFQVIDMFGWQLSLSRMPKNKLGSSDWTDDDMDEICDLEFRLAQERSLLGCAPTIQFVAKKISTDEENDIINQPSASQ